MEHVVVFKYIFTLLEMEKKQRNNYLLAVAFKKLDGVYAEKQQCRDNYGQEGNGYFVSDQ